MYKLINNCDYVKKNDGSIVLKKSDEYQQWLAIPGNTPDPADVPVPPVRYLSKYVFVNRVIARGRMDTVLAVINDPSNKVAKVLYDAAQELAADPEDPMLRPMLKAAGYTDEEVTEELRA